MQQPNCEKGWKYKRQETRDYLTTEVHKGTEEKKCRSTDKIKPVRCITKEVHGFKSDSCTDIITHTDNNLQVYL